MNKISYLYVSKVNALDLFILLLNTLSGLFLNIIVKVWWGMFWEYFDLWIFWYDVCKFFIDLTEQDIGDMVVFYLL